MTLELPKYVNANGLIDLLKLLSEQPEAGVVDIDFRALRRITPAGLVALTSFVQYRTFKGLSTTCDNIEDCSILGYLQRMNFFKSAGLRELPEGFTRHSCDRKFYPVTPITGDTEVLGTDIANIIAPGGDDYDNPNAGLWDAAFYLVTELANNVRQHGLRPGFVAAQSTHTDGYVRIAIGDLGIGIKGSLEAGGHIWASESSDLECIQQAVTARVSSKGQPSNEGVGLTLCSRVATLMGGRILVASGSGIIATGDDGETSFTEELPGSGINGTVVTVAFRRPKAAHFDDHLLKAKELENLLQRSHSSANFTS